LNTAPSPPNKAFCTILSIIIQDPQVRPCRPIVGVEGRLKKKPPQDFRYRVPDVPE